MYIIHEDDQGQRFADALLRKAAEGVQVRLLYDWMGGFRKTSARFWNRLRGGGIDVRCYNPPRFDRPLAWLSRDHRKTITADSTIAFVTGLCVGRMWMGDPPHVMYQSPYGADYGYGKIRGPAVADVEAAFAEGITAAAGYDAPPVPLARAAPSRAGVKRFRVVATVPNTAGSVQGRFNLWRRWPGKHSGSRTPITPVPRHM